MDLFEYILTLFVLCIILMFVYYIFTHTKESYENTRGGAIIPNTVTREKERPNPSFNGHAVWNYVANLPRYMRDLGKNGDDDTVTLDFNYAQENHPIFYKLGVFDSLQDKSEKYFNDERFREIQSKIRYINVAFAWLEKYKCGIYNRLREKFSSQQTKAR